MAAPQIGNVEEIAESATPLAAAPLAAAVEEAPETAENQMNLTLIVLLVLVLVAVIFFLSKKNREENA